MPSLVSDTTPSTMKLMMTIVAKTGRRIEMSEIHISVSTARDTGLTFVPDGDVLPRVRHDHVARVQPFGDLHQRARRSLPQPPEPRAPCRPQFGTPPACRSRVVTASRGTASTCAARSQRNRRADAVHAGQQRAPRVGDAHLDSGMAVPRVDFRRDGRHASIEGVAGPCLRGDPGRHADTQSSGLQLRHAGFELHHAQIGDDDDRVVARTDEAAGVVVAFDDDAGDWRRECGVALHLARAAQSRFGLRHVRLRQVALRAPPRLEPFRPRRAAAAEPRRDRTGSARDRARAPRWPAPPRLLRGRPARRSPPRLPRRPARRSHGDRASRRPAQPSRGRRCRRPHVDSVPGSFAMTATRVCGMRLPEICSADSTSDTPTLIAATSTRCSTAGVAAAAAARTRRGRVVTAAPSASPEQSDDRMRSRSLQV